ncbi:unnamed protein product [Caenorhabditis auriculariae]|uniref:G protein-coupled receptor n=1 Tax=Caenorhabditis auriculariae TaxID=2777116 RepID=A0A8S1H2D5_9PELO|nr:unnamed protein product [Caenorhabditis auriculariae]
MVTVAHLFLYRLFAVLPEGHHCVPKRKLAQLSSAGAMYIIGVVPAPIASYFLLCPDEIPLKIKVAQEYGICAPPNLWDPFFLILDLKDPKIILGCCLLMCLFWGTGISCLSFTIAGFLLLKEYASHYSAQTAKMHRAFILSLILQVSAHTIISAVPISVILVKWFNDTLTNDFVNVK